MDEGDKDLWMESIPRLRSLPRNSAGIEVHVFRKLDIWYHQITRMCPLGLRLRTFFYNNVMSFFWNSVIFFSNSVKGAELPL